MRTENLRWYKSHAALVRRHCTRQRPQSSNPPDNSTTGSLAPGMDSKVDISKAHFRASSSPLPFAQSTSTPHRQPLAHVHKVLLRSVLLVSGLFALRCLSPYLQLPGSSSRTTNGVQWSSCGDGFQCANISVPLDHHNASDGRTASIAVVRLLAEDKGNRFVTAIHP